VLQQPTMNMDELIKLILPAVIGGFMGIIGGIISSIFATRSKMKEIAETFSLEQRAKENEAKAKVRIQYLNPLQIATIDFHGRLCDIQSRLNRGDKLLRNTMQELKERTHQADRYVQWVNDFGHYALSTLYLTNLYLAHVSKIRSELPFVELSSGEDQALLDHLSRVRCALGGEFGIWENLQDSFGSYIQKGDGSLMNFKEFCSFIYDDSSFPWFFRLVDFYRDMDLKTPSQLQEMIDSLRALITFLSDKSKQALPERE